MRAPCSRLFVFAVASSSIAACVGEEALSPSGVSDRDAASSDDGGPGPTERDANASGSNDASTEASADASFDAAPDSAGPPAEPSCTVAALKFGAFSTRCRASAPTITAGGDILDGEYLLSSFWENAGCVGGNFVIGSASIYSEGGQRFMRFRRENRVTTDGVSLVRTGTYRLELAGGGAVARVERCDPSTKDVRTAGNVQVVAGPSGALTFVFSNTVEVWDKVP